VLLVIYTVIDDKPTIFALFKVCAITGRRLIRLHEDCDVLNYVDFVTKMFSLVI